MATNKFPCNGCGSCCKRIDIKNIEDAGETFPYQVVNGRCEKLSDDNKCTVYENRPDVCNIDFMITKFKMDREKAHKQTALLCNAFMASEGLTNFIKID